MLRKIVVLFLLLINIALCKTSVTINPTIVKQGNCFTVEVNTSAEFDKATVIFNNHTYPLYQTATNNYRIIIGTSYDTPVKPYPLIIRLFKNSEKIYAKKIEVPVIKTKFETSTLIIKKSTEDTGATNFDVLAQENVIIGKAFKTYSQKQLWSDIFKNPLAKKWTITSSYGKQRFYRNEAGGLISTWAHRGIDYGVSTGNPVYAVNSGIITVAQPMQVHGTTLAIDHGQGISSIYNHLNTLLVKKGEYVTRGQRIALSGNSGLTTGPHLHFGLSVNNVRVNPQEWFERVF